MTPAAPLFQAEHLHKRYGDADVVNGVSLHIRPGECLGVIGPNGAGKTTTLRMCLGLTTPDSGSVRFGAPGPDREDARRDALLDQREVAGDPAQTLANGRGASRQEVDHLGPPGCRSEVRKALEA